MNKTTKCILTLLAIFTLAACDPTPSTPAPGHISTTNSPDGKCHEDDPCWDCSTMGNRKCGPLVDAPDADATDCWWENNDDMPDEGYRELICGTPAEHDAARHTDYYLGEVIPD